MSALPAVFELMMYVNSFIVLYILWLISPSFLPVTRYFNHGSSGRTTHIPLQCMKWPCPLNLARERSGCARSTLRKPLIPRIPRGKRINSPRSRSFPRISSSRHLGQRPLSCTMFIGAGVPSQRWGSYVARKIVFYDPALIVPLGHSLTYLL